MQFIAKESTANPNQPWRHFCFLGTQPLDLADYVGVAGRRREDVEALPIRRGHRSATGALFGAQAEGICADWEIVSDHRRSGGGIGWLLDSSGTAERGD